MQAPEERIAFSLWAHFAGRSARRDRRSGLGGEPIGFPGIVFAADRGGRFIKQGVLAHLYGGREEHSGEV